MNLLYRIVSKNGRHRDFVAKIRLKLDEKDVDEAEDMSQRALSYYPNSTELKLLFAESIYGRGEYAEGRQIVNKVLEQTVPSPKAYFAAVRFLMECGDDDTALRVLEPLASHANASVAGHAHYMRAIIFSRRNNFRAALSAAAAGLAKRDHGILYEIFTTLLRESGDGPDNREYVERLLAAPSPDRRQRSTAYYLALAEAYRAINDLESATSCLVKAKQAARPKRRFMPLTKSPSSHDALAPSFLIIGAMKCGTTSLFKKIAAHPSVLEPVMKEVQYFHGDAASLDWYLAHFPDRPHEDAVSITGEASPAYYSQDIQESVHGLFPHMKLICILRNPVRRFISHWFHIQRMGRVLHELPQIPIRDLQHYRQLTRQNDDHIECELFGMWTDATKTNHLVALGFYYYFLRRWFRYFPSNQVLLLTLTDLSLRPVETMSRVYEFLGIRSDFRSRLIHRNAGNYPVENLGTSAVERQLAALYQPSVDKLQDEFGIALGDI